MSALQMARDIGMKWSREEFGWAVIEPQKGKFDWSFYDRVVATAKRHGISIYGLLDYWSTWTKPYTPEGIEDYCRYVRAVVQRYKNDIHHWEVWNEPNIFFWEGPKDRYADLLKAAYKTIKEVDPTAQVAGCSTSGIDLDFVRRVMELGGPFDILTVHPYRLELQDRPFIQELREAAALVRQPDGQPRPVWITEMGWGTHMPHNVQRYGNCVRQRRAGHRPLEHGEAADGIRAGACPGDSDGPHGTDARSPSRGWQGQGGPRAGRACLCCLRRCTSGRQAGRYADERPKRLCHRLGSMVWAVQPALRPAPQQQDVRGLSRCR